MYDVAFYMVNSLEVADRRALEKPILEHYHSCLIAGGVSDYTFEVRPLANLPPTSRNEPTPLRWQSRSRWRSREHWPLPRELQTRRRELQTRRPRIVCSARGTITASTS